MYALSSYFSMTEMTASTWLDCLASRTASWKATRSALTAEPEPARSSTNGGSMTASLERLLTARSTILPFVSCSGGRGAALLRGTRRARAYNKKSRRCNHNEYQTLYAAHNCDPANNPCTHRHRRWILQPHNDCGSCERCHC